MGKLKHEHSRSRTNCTVSLLDAKRRAVSKPKWEPQADFWKFHFTESELHTFIQLFDRLAAKNQAAGELVRATYYRNHVLSISVALAKIQNAAASDAKARPVVEEISQSDCNEILRK